jgi:hypothetical protein
MKNRLITSGFINILLNHVPKEDINEFLTIVGPGFVDDEKRRMIEFAKLCLDKALDLDINTVHSNVEQYYNENYES